MSKKTFYRYNPQTESYERVYPSRSQRYRAVAREFAVGGLFGILVSVAAYYCIDFPRERALRQTNERMEASLEALSRQTDQALAVMENIAARDNNLYRVMLQAEPLSDAARYAGLENRFAHIDSMGDNALLADVNRKVERLRQMIYHQSKSFDFLADQVGSMNERISCVPAIQPISSKYLKQMASGYGYRTDPIYGTSRFHEGMDYSAAIGTPVYATGDGRVTEAGWSSGGYGLSVDINHGFNYLTRYAHLSEVNVKPGQNVRRGDLIGKVGNTGKSTGPHLHYEVRLNGQPQNPVNYYFMDLTPAEYDEMIRQAENAGHVMD